MTAVHRWILAASLAVAACSPPGGVAYVRAHAAGDRAYTAGRFLEAAEAYERAAEQASRPRDRDEAIYAAAVSRERGGDVEGALRHFDALAAHEPPGERAIRAGFRAAMIRIERGEAKRGYADLAALVRRAPEHGVARRALQTILANVEETEGKEAAIAWEEKLFPAVASTRLGEEICYDVAHRKAALGQTEPALARFLACADQYPYPTGALWDDSLWHASLLHEQLGQPKAAIADLQRMLDHRETSYLSGSYNRPRMAAAQYRIAELQRDVLNDPAAARASFHRVYVEHPTSILRSKALFHEAKLAQEAGDGSAACKLATTILDEFADTRWARRADDVCPAVADRAEALRKQREERRKKSAGAADAADDD